MNKETVARVPEIRCLNCRRLLGLGRTLDLAIKCPRCKTINTFKGSH